MATVTTSIGTRSAINLDITNATGSDPYTVTVDDEGDAQVGDALTDEHAAPRKYLITAVAAGSLTVVDSEGIGSAPDFAGGSQATVVRYYATITLFDAQLDDTNKYASADEAVGELYADS